jgi:hypothetical protein
MWLTFVVFLFCAFFFSSFVYISYQYRELLQRVSSSSANEALNLNVSTKITLLRVPVRKDGVIFVSDGAKGQVREAAVELSKLGYHVLVGAKTDAEIRSFAFDSRKGLELIKFDITSPATFVDLVYRLRQIRRDLDRPLVGVVLNLAGKIRCSLYVCIRQ